MRSIMKIELTVSSLEIANDVLEKLETMAGVNGCVSVAGYNDLVRINDGDVEEEEFYRTVGWSFESLQGVVPEKTGRNEFTIKFPPVEVLK